MVRITEQEGRILYGRNWPAKRAQLNGFSLSDIWGGVQSVAKWLTGGTTTDPNKQLLTILEEEQKQRAALLKWGAIIGISLIAAKALKD